MKKQRWRARDYVVIPRSLLTQDISPRAFTIMDSSRHRIAMTVTVAFLLIVRY